MTIAELMETNLLRVFGEKDPVRRREVIERIYAENCNFIDPRQEITGYDAISANVDALQSRFPNFVFKVVGEPSAHHDIGRLSWQYGPLDAPPEITGMDIALIENDRIRTLYVFID